MIKDQLPNMSTPGFYTPQLNNKRQIIVGSNLPK